MNLDWLFGPSCKGCGSRPNIGTIGWNHRDDCREWADMRRRQTAYLRSLDDEEASEQARATLVLP